MFKGTPQVTAGGGDAHPPRHWNIPVCALQTESNHFTDSSCVKFKCVQVELLPIGILELDNDDQKPTIKLWQRSKREAISAKIGPRMADDRGKKDRPRLQKVGTSEEMAEKEWRTKPRPL